MADFENGAVREKRLQHAIAVADRSAVVMKPLATLVRRINWLTAAMFFMWCGLIVGNSWSVSDDGLSEVALAAVVLAGLGWGVSRLASNLGKITEAFLDLGDILRRYTSFEEFDLADDVLNELLFRMAGFDLADISIWRSDDLIRLARLVLKATATQEVMSARTYTLGFISVGLVIWLFGLTVTGAAIGMVLA